MVGYYHARTTTYLYVYVKSTISRGKFIILLLYVNDMLIVGRDTKMIGKLKKEVFGCYDMKDLGQASIFFLGVQIISDRKAKKLWLSQKRYIKKVLVI